MAGKAKNAGSTGVFAQFKSCDEEGFPDVYSECAERTIDDLMLLNDPESFTETRTLRLYPSSDSDLEMDMTFDLKVEYHP